MKKAFTLIELIFVIVIVGVLAAVAIPKYKNLAMHSEISKIVELVKTIKDHYQSTWTYQTSLEGKNPQDIRLEDMFDTYGGRWVKANNATQFGKDWQYYTKKSLANQYILNLRPRQGYLNFWVVCGHYNNVEYQNLCVEKIEELGYKANQNKLIVINIFLH